MIWERFEFVVQRCHWYLDLVLMLFLWMIFYSYWKWAG